jgi:hypothetical protein
MVSSDKVSLESVGDISGGSLVSDIGVSAIEQEFNIDFEKVVDVFAKTHKNSRIMLI